MPASYLDTLQQIRERIQTLNATLPCNQAAPTFVNPHATHVDPMMPKGTNRHERELYERSVQQTQNVSYVASLNEFSLHWETMTYAQRRKHLDEYVDSQYADHDDTQLEQVRTFLYRQVLDDARHGHARVKWNGYFVDHVPAVEITDGGVVRFGNNGNAKKKTKTSSGATTSAAGGFHALRNRLRREKQGFYASEWVDEAQ